MSDSDWEIINRITLTSFAVPLLLCIVLVVFIMLYQRKVHRQREENQRLLLKEQELLIERQQALEVERQRIAAELHDDLGSGLTGIRYLSEAALNSKNGKSKQHLERIQSKAQGLVTSMSEIIWAMNTSFDSLSDLFVYIRHYAVNYLAEQNLDASFSGFDGIHVDTPLDGHVRRHIYLIVKEALHNAVKHGSANSIRMQANLQGDTLVLSMTELGNTFDPQAQDVENGHGIFNMTKRAKEINGHIDFSNQGDGFTTTLSFHLPIATS